MIRVPQKLPKYLKTTTSYENIKVRPLKNEFLVSRIQIQLEINLTISLMDENLNFIAHADTRLLSLFLQPNLQTLGIMNLVV